MTSDATQEATEDFFIEHNCFGYSREHIIFFEQLNIPVLNLHGKILMKNKGSLCWSPGMSSCLLLLIDRAKWIA